MRRRLRATALTGAALLAGCATMGPNHRAPEPPPGSQASFISAMGPAFSRDGVPDDWWRLYEDPALDGLVERALEANRDLAVAAANLARARAVLRETRNQRLPQTTTSAEATYGRESGAALGLDGAADDRLLLDVGLDASYEIDLWGRVTRTIEAARADIGVANAALDVARVSVVAETTRAYANACSAAQQITAARRILQTQDETLTLTRRMQQAGRGNGLDVARAQAERDRRAAAIPPLEAERAGAIFRLAVLTGRPPSALPPSGFLCSAAPRLDRPVPVGDGADLLRRRPDIRLAERELAGATARIGVATADLYPTIGIGASVGSTGTSLGDLASGSGFRFGLGPLISWSFPNLGAARARIRQAEAGAQASLARFDSAVLEALGETETALSAYARELERRAAVASGRAASARAAELARLRFRNGADSFLVLLDAERTLAEADADLAASDRQLVDLQVSLFKALGGGWQGTPQATQ